MNPPTKILVILLFLISIIMVSGCISLSKRNIPIPETETQQPSAIPTIHYSANQSPFIHIDPIQDFDSVSPFNITGPTNLTISGITNFPAGSLFWVDIIEEERNRSLFSNIVIPAELGKDGLNTLSYNTNIKGNPPSRYRVEIRKANRNVSATAYFNITSQESWLWTTIDPVEAHVGQNVNVTGSTDLPVGSEITVISQIFWHPCPIDPDPNSTDPFRSCRINCSDAFLQTPVRVMPGINGKNKWASIINTTEWCRGQSYLIYLRVDNWTNVTEGTLDEVWYR